MVSLHAIRQFLLAVVMATFGTQNSQAAEPAAQKIEPSSALSFQEFCDSFDLYPEGCELTVTGIVESISHNHTQLDGSSFSKIRLHNPIASFVRLRLVDFWCNPADVEDLHHGQHVTISGRFFDKKMVFSQYTGLRDCSVLEKGDVPTSAAPLPPRLSNQEMETHHQQFLELRELDGVTILSDLTHNIRIEFDALTPKGRIQDRILNTLKRNLWVHQVALHCYLTTDLLRDVASIEYLRTLELVEDFVGDNVRQNISFEPLANNLFLTDIDIKHLPEATTAELKSLSAIPFLRKLYIAEPLEGKLVLSDDHLLAIAQSRNLEKLYLPPQSEEVECSITDKGLGYLRNCQELRFLQLSSGSISGHGLPLLEMLEALDFTGSSVTSDGLKRLSAFPKLQALDLTSTQVDDELEATLSQLDNLRILNTQGTTLSDDIVDSILNEVARKRSMQIRKKVRVILNK